MESINRQLKRRTNVISIFPSEASLLRIVTAKAMDLSDEWEGLNGKAYISPKKLQQAAEVLKAASSQPKTPLFLKQHSAGQKTGLTSNVYGHL